MLRAVTIAFGMLVCVPPVLALQGRNTGSIVGTVRVEGPQPLLRIEVKLESRFSLVAVSHADNEGRFVFPDLAPNLYHVVVDEDEYEPVRVSAVISAISPQTQFVRIELKPKKKDQPSSQPAIPSGANPNLIDLASLNKSYPRKAIKFFEKGLKLSSQGKVDEAIERFEDALELSPEFYQARNNLGTALMQRGNLDRAESEFRTVIRQQEADAAAYFNLANVLLLTSRLPESRGLLESGLRREPNSATGVFLLGTVYSRLGNVTEAEKNLNAALELDPMMSKVYLELANLYIRQNNKPRAAEQLALFLSRYPNDPMAPQARQVLERLQH